MDEPTPNPARQAQAAHHAVQAMQAMQAMVELRDALLDLHARLECARLMLRLRTGRTGR